MLGGKKLFLLAVDDKSRYMWLVLLSSKDQAADAIIRLQVCAEAEAGHKLGTLRTDRGSEVTSRAFGEYCAMEGVQRHLTAPYTPQQNGVVERRNQTVLGMARSMLKAMRMPGWFWGEAVLTAIFILNRSPTRNLEGITPYEAWYGSKPPVHFFRTFGCVAHVKAAGGHLKKLDDRSTPMVFIGYETGTKAYRFYNPVSKRVHISRDAVFDEGRAWSWTERDGGAHSADSEPFLVEYTTVSEMQEGSTLGGSPAHSRGGVSGGTPVAPGTPTSSASAPGGAHGSGAPGTPASSTPGSPVEFASPPSGDLDLDEGHDDEVPLRFRTLDNVLGPAGLPGMAAFS